MEEHERVITRQPMELKKEIVTAKLSPSTFSPPEHPGYGKCADCSCPGFTGSGYTCTRGGCKHHYDRHW